MAFNPERLSLLVQPIGEGGLRFFGYQTDDVEATLTAAGYATNAADYGLRAYDLVFISPANGTEEPYILAVESIDADGHATLASPGPIGDMLKTSVFPATRTVLKALDTSRNTVAFLKESGREGQFIFRAGDYSTQIAADPLEGVYIKADAIAATAGAWVRVYKTWLYINWFGAVPNVAVDQQAAIQAAINLSYTTQDRVRVPHGIWRCDSGLTITQYCMAFEGEPGIFVAGGQTLQSSLDFTNAPENVEALAIYGTGGDRLFGGRISNLSITRPIVTKDIGGAALRINSLIGWTFEDIVLGGFDTLIQLNSRVADTQPNSDLNFNRLHLLGAAKAKIEIRGGVNITFKKVSGIDTTGTQDHYVVIGAGSVTGLTRPDTLTFENCVFVENGTASKPIRGVRIEDGFLITFRDCVVEQCVDTAFEFAYSTAQDLGLVNVTLDNVHTDRTGYGIFNASARCNFKVLGGRYGSLQPQPAPWSGATKEASIVVSDATTNIVQRDILIQGATITGSGLQAIRIFNTSGMRVMNNLILMQGAGASNDGLAYAAYTTNNIAIGNIINTSSASTQGIYEGTGNVVVNNIKMAP